MPAMRSSSSLDASPCRPMKPRSAARPTSSRSTSTTTICPAFQPRSSSSVRGDRAAVAEAADDHVVLQVCLQTHDAPFLDEPLDDQLVRRPEEQQPDEDPHGRDKKSIDQPCLVRDRHDVAVADGRDRDHREIKNVDQRDVAVDVVLQAGTVEHEHGKDGADEQEHQAGPQQQRRPPAVRAALADQDRRRAVTALARGCAAWCGAPSRSARGTLYGAGIAQLGRPACCIITSACCLR